MRMLTEAFGRAKIWRRMLEAEPRAESAVMAEIAAENQGALDQGVVLPCAPSDEEKVGAVARGVSCMHITRFSLSTPSIRVSVV